MRKIFLSLLFCMVFYQRLQSLEQFEPYLSSCSFLLRSQTAETHSRKWHTESCLIAMFSSYSNHSLDLTIASNLLLQTQQNEDFDTFCSSRSILLVSSERRGNLAIAKRGSCSFLRKIEVAQTLGYNALLVVNTEDELFLIGGESENLTFKKMSIPLFLVTSASLSNLHSSAAYITEMDSPNNQMVDVHLQYERAKPAQYSFNNSNDTNSLSFLMIFLLACSPVLMLIKESTKIAQNYFLCGVIALIGFSLKLGTHRLLSPLSVELTKFDHNETDERVYHSLVNSILLDWSDYRLDQDFIRRFQLSEENYSDDVFIHPPVFVYVAAFLHSFGLSLAVIPSIFHLITAGCIILCVDIIDVPLKNQIDIHTVRTWAVLIFVFCPISFFCSQKVNLFKFVLYYVLSYKQCIF
jgi:hypothetical protein